MTLQVIAKVQSDPTASGEGITAATPDRSRGDATMTLEGVIRVALKKVFSVTFGVLFEENPLLAPPPLGSGQSSHGPTLAPDTAPAKIVKTHRIH